MVENARTLYRAAAGIDSALAAYTPNGAVGHRYFQIDQRLGAICGLMSGTTSLRDCIPLDEAVETTRLHIDSGSAGLVAGGAVRPVSITP